MTRIPRFLSEDPASKADAETEAAQPRVDQLLSRLGAESSALLLSGATQAHRNPSGLVGGHLLEPPHHQAPARWTEQRRCTEINIALANAWSAACRSGDYQLDLDPQRCEAQIMMVLSTLPLRGRDPLGRLGTAAPGILSMIEGARWRRQLPPGPLTLISHLLCAESAAKYLMAIFGAAWSQGAGAEHLGQMLARAGYTRQAGSAKDPTRVEQIMQAAARTDQAALALGAQASGAVSRATARHLGRPARSGAQRGAAQEN